MSATVLSGGKSKGCEVRPSVILEICEAFARRPGPIVRRQPKPAAAGAGAGADNEQKLSKREIQAKEARQRLEDEALAAEEHHDVVHGILMGVKRAGRFVVEECFAVPHVDPVASLFDEEAAEDRTYLLDQRYVWKLTEMHRRLNAKIIPIGWYSAGPFAASAAKAAAGEKAPVELGVPAALMHEFFVSQMRGRAPINLVVDTSLTDGKLAVRAYSGTDIVLDGTKLGTQFTKVCVDITPGQEEGCGLELLSAAVKSADQTLTVQGTDNLLASLQGLSNLVKQLEQYSASDKRSGAVGRAILEALDSSPALPEGQVDKMVEASTQDAALVLYLAQMAKAQVSLSEQLTRVVM